MFWNQPSSSSRFTREAGVGLFDVEDERGVGHAQELGHDDAGLAVAEVVGLQAGEDEVGALRFGGGGKKLGDAEGVALVEVVGFRPGWRGRRLWRGLRGWWFRRAPDRR